MLKGLFKKDEFKHLGAFYIERFISHLIYFAPAFWIIFFNETFSLTEISILFSILAISTFIFEIPTGAFADNHGRKASTLLSYILITFLLPTFIFINNFYLMALAFLLWGLFSTFYSGAREAWVVDNLKFYKRNDLVKSYFLKEHSAMKIGMFLSGLLGAFVVGFFGIYIIWVFASLSWLISFFLLLKVPEHKLSKEKKTTFKKVFKQAKTSISYSLKHHALLFIFLSVFFIMFRDAFGSELIWQPYLESLGFPIFAFGILFSVSMILGSLTPLVYKPIFKFCKTEKNYLILLLIIGMLLNFSVFYVNSYISAVIIFLSILFVIDLFIPVTGSFVQGFIPSKKRATIISFKGMIISLAYAISYPFAGLTADKLGSQMTIILGGLFLIPAIWLHSKIKVKKVNKKIKV